MAELENASLKLERKDSENQAEYARWIRMLVAPGGSLGGARPKASVSDSTGGLWIAKFPSVTDEYDVGLWEMLVYILAEKCQLSLSLAQVRKFTNHHTFLVKRFDRTVLNRRIFYMSAMTALEKIDGESSNDGTSYIDLAQFLVENGVNTDKNLEELWSRVAFNMLVSNTDDHLRNHGFILTTNGWELSPAFDLNVNADGNGLFLNVSESDNSQDLELLMSVAKHFRLTPQKAKMRLTELKSVVMGWKKIAKQLEISAYEQTLMARAFRLA